MIELAQADGITQSSCTYDAALDASTFGVGQLIVHALDRGATSLYIGLGGSASTDGGAGLLMALGAHLFDEAGGQIGRGLRGLENLASIDLSPALERLRNVSVSILNDVTNPLVGGSWRGANLWAAERLMRAGRSCRCPRSGRCQSGPLRQASHAGA